MTNLTFEEWACRNTRARLDAYIDDELLVETNLEMARHFECCPECAREAGVRRELRARVKGAVRLASVPDGLESRLRDRIRRSGRERSMPWSVMAIAAAIILCVGSWFPYQRSMLRIAVADHVHCAVIRQGFLKPVGQDKLSAQYKPVLAIARENVPAEMHLTVAHECTFEGRKFVHVTFKDDHRLLSVIVTRRGEWERLPAGLHGMQIQGFQTAGFETGGYLVYTVSDLPKRENLRILSAMAPALRNALNRGEPV
jgi:anti-sigma factor (TIGR02949 family)